MNYHGIQPEWLFNGGGAFYEITSGPIVILSALTFAWTYYRKHNCHAPGCPWIGHRSLADGTPVCKHHHPDRRRSLAELHRDHEAAK